MTTLFTLIFLITHHNTGIADRQTDKVLEQTRKLYENLDEVCAEFTQIFHWKLTDETQIIKGTICAKGGDKFKISTDEQLIVTNGKVLWTLNKQNGQVIVDTAENSSDNPFVKDFLQKYINDYDALVSDECSTNELICVRMTSKSGSDFVSTMRLWINRKTDFIQKIEQIDLNENTTTFEFSQIATDVSLSNKDFSLDIPSGADVIDMR